VVVSVKRAKGEVLSGKRVKGGEALTPEIKKWSFR
jgi:hypothetical protein